MVIDILIIVKINHMIAHFVEEKILISYVVFRITFINFLLFLNKR